jgi:transposase
MDLSITSGDRNDRRDAGETAENMEKDDLIIRDLGYFSTSVLKKCMEKEAFFLSRLDSATNVYDESGNVISFREIYKSMQESRTIDKCLFVYAGRDTKLPVRLIIRVVPDEVYEKRIRDKTRKSKGQGRGELMEETRIRCRFNLFITNAEDSLFPADRVFPLYRLRWQIELQFKIWKSVFRIDCNLQKIKEHRYITLLCIKLLLIIINLQITYSVQQAFVQPKKDKVMIISLNKALKTLKTIFDKIFSMLRSTNRKAEVTARYVRNRLLENHWLESKKKKVCLPEIIGLFICLSEK